MTVYLLVLLSMPLLGTACDLRNGSALRPGMKSILTI